MREKGPGSGSRCLEGGGITLLARSSACASVTSIGAGAAGGLDGCEGGDRLCRVRRGDQLCVGSDTGFTEGGTDFGGAEVRGPSPARLFSALTHHHPIFLTGNISIQDVSSLDFYF